MSCILAIEMLPGIADDCFGDGRIVDVHVRRLRTKLKVDPSQPEVLVTVQGLGYKLQP